jgi:hypothetical protein
MGKLQQQLVRVSIATQLDDDEVPSSAGLAFHYRSERNCLDDTLTIRVALDLTFNHVYK